MKNSNSKFQNQDIVKKCKNKIIFKDCINGMNDLPSNSADVALADPPYNLSKGNSWKWDNSVELPGMGGDWKKVMEDWDDMPHVWHHYAPILPEARKAIGKIGDFVLQHTG